jgi:RNA polymerase sigma factor (sigma-70 family)
LGFSPGIEEKTMRDPGTTTLSTTSSDDLLTRLQRGDESALSDLADTFGSKIYQLAFRYLRNKEDAEEVTQDVLLKVHRKVGSFRGDSALSSWIYRITFNAAMSRLRTARYQRTLDEDRQRESDNADGIARTDRADVADWSRMADEGVLRSRAGRAPRSAGDVDRRSERDAEGERPDAQVAAAPRTADPSQTARGLRRRTHDAPADLRDLIRAG